MWKAMLALCLVVAVAPYSVRADSSQALASVPNVALEFTKLEIDGGADKIKAGARYVAAMPYQGSPVVDLVGAKCSWSGEGPYFFDAIDNIEKSRVEVRLKTRNPGTYELACFAIYKVGGAEHQTNTVKTTIKVKKG